MLGQFWGYMTPDYIFEQMTWAEIGAAMDYIFRYEIKESHHKNSIKLSEWIYEKKDHLKQDLKDIANKLRGKK